MSFIRNVHVPIFLFLWWQFESIRWLIRQQMSTNYFPLLKSFLFLRETGLCIKFWTNMVANRKTLHHETYQHQSLRIDLLYSMPLLEETDLLGLRKGPWRLLSLLLNRPVHRPQCKQTLLTLCFPWAESDTWHWNRPTQWISTKDSFNPQGIFGNTHNLS